MTSDRAQPADRQRRDRAGSSRAETATGTRPKRTKTSAACAPCQLRKSRCELVDAAGCHRCRLLGTACDFAAASSQQASESDGEAPPNAQVVAQPPRGGQAGRAEQAAHATALARVEARLAGVESLLTELRASSAVRLGFAQDAAEVHKPGRSASMASMITAALGLQDVVAFVDPVEAKAMTLRQWNDVYARSSAALSAITPLVVPATHAFVRSALAHTTSYAPSLVDRILQHNLSVVRRALPSIDTAHALLALSLAPARTEAELAHVDRHGAAAHALAVARELGLDDAVLRFHVEDWDAGHASECAERVCLWYTIVHRAAWVDIFSTPSFITDKPALPITAVFSGATRTTSLVDHLTLEAQLLSAVAPLAAAVQRVRVAREHLHHDVAHATSTFDTLHAEVAVWRATAEAGPARQPVASWPFLDLTARLVEMALCLKVSTELAGLLPSPLGPAARLETVFHFGAALVDACGAVIDHVLATRPDIGALPACHAALCFLPVATLLQMARVEREAGAGLDAGPGADGGDEAASPDDRYDRVRPGLAAYVQQLRLGLPEATAGRLAHIEAMTAHKAWVGLRQERDAQTLGTGAWAAGALGGDEWAAAEHDYDFALLFQDIFGLPVE